MHMDKSEEIKDKSMRLDHAWIRVKELMNKRKISQVDMVKI